MTDLPAHHVAEDRTARRTRLAALMERVSTGDADAFEALYDEMAPMVYGTAVRILRDPDHAAEVAQEVLVEVWGSASHFNPLGGSVPAWVATIAHRRAVDRVRAVESQRARDERAGVQGYEPPRDSVSEEAERSMERQLLWGCMDTLTELQREAVCHAYYGGRTYREVAERAGIGLPTVKSRIRDGLKRLRECLEVQR